MTHDKDQDGQPIHIDIDPYIPTGVCAICAGVDQDTTAPEDRAPSGPADA